MNQLVRPKIGASACPHDCPSTCALEVEIIDGRTIGRVRGAEENAYTAGVICAKVARYAERVHHPDRLLHPLRRVGAKGSGEFAPISWDDALDLVAEKFQRAEQKHGSEAVWPYYYAGTMGFVQRDGINRLRHAKKYSGFFSTICVNPAWTGFIAGTGKLAGADPREMAKMYTRTMTAALRYSACDRRKSRGFIFRSIRRRTSPIGPTIVSGRNFGSA